MKIDEARQKWKVLMKAREEEEGATTCYHLYESLQEKQERYGHVLIFQPGVYLPLTPKTKSIEEIIVPEFQELVHFFRTNPDLVADVHRKAEQSHESWLQIVSSVGFLYSLIN